MYRVALFYSIPHSLRKEKFSSTKHGTFATECYESGVIKQFCLKVDERPLPHSSREKAEKGGYKYGVVGNSRVQLEAIAGY